MKSLLIFHTTSSAPADVTSQKCSALESPLLKLCLSVGQFVQTGSYYFIWQLAVVTSCRLIYHINVAESAHCPQEEGSDKRQIVR